MNFVRCANRTVSYRKVGKLFKSSYMMLSIEKPRGAEAERLKRITDSRMSRIFSKIILKSHQIRSSIHFFLMKIMYGGIKSFPNNTSKEITLRSM